MDLEEKIRRGVCGASCFAIGGYLLRQGLDLVPDTVKSSRLLFEQIQRADVHQLYKVMDYPNILFYSVPVAILFLSGLVMLHTGQDIIRTGYPYSRRKQQ